MFDPERSFILVAIVDALSTHHVDWWRRNSIDGDVPKAMSGQSVKQSRWGWLSWIISTSTLWNEWLPLSLCVWCVFNVLIDRKNSFNVFDASWIGDFDNFQIWLLDQVIFDKAFELGIVIEVICAVDLHRRFRQIVIHLRLVLNLRTKMINFGLFLKLSSQIYDFRTLPHRPRIGFWVDRWTPLRGCRLLLHPWTIAQYIRRHRHPHRAYLEISFQFQVTFFLLKMQL